MVWVNCYRSNRPLMSRVEKKQAPPSRASWEGKRCGRSSPKSVPLPQHIDLNPPINLITSQDTKTIDPTTAYFPLDSELSFLRDLPVKPLDFAHLFCKPARQKWRMRYVWIQAATASRPSEAVFSLLPSSVPNAALAAAIAPKNGPCLAHTSLLDLKEHSLTIPLLIQRERCVLFLVGNQNRIRDPAGGDILTRGLKIAARLFSPASASRPSATMRWSRT